MFFEYRDSNSKQLSNVISLLKTVQNYSTGVDQREQTKTSHKRQINSTSSSVISQDISQPKERFFVHPLILIFILSQQCSRSLPVLYEHFKTLVLISRILLFKNYSMQWSYVAFFNDILYIIFFFRYLLRRYV